MLTLHIEADTHEQLVNAAIKVLGIIAPEAPAAPAQLPDPAPWPHLRPDPKDVPFLALAHSAGAWLVTGNLKPFPESGRAGVVVLSPNDYLADLVGELLRPPPSLDEI